MNAQLTTDPKPTHSHPPPSNYRLNWVLIGFLAIAAFFLLAEHQAHVLGALPYILLLACPLMHIFGHGGHRGHGNHDAGDSRDSKENKS